MKTYPSPQDADVVGERIEEESASSPVGACVDDLSGEPFDHRVDGFDLPALAVAALLEMTFHLCSIAAGRFPGRRSAMGGGNQRLDPQLVTSQLVARSGYRALGANVELNKVSRVDVCRDLPGRNVEPLKSAYEANHVVCRRTELTASRTL